MRRSWTSGIGLAGGLFLVMAVATVTIGQTPDPGFPAVDAAPNGAVTATPGRSVPSPVTPMATAEGMLGFASSDGSGGQMVTLVDARRSWMAVYSVDAKGQLKLLSSRPLSQDFSVQYNVTEPTPAAIGRLNSR